ncbi:glycosyltransferase family 1 protein [Mycobacterium eburneum]|nr:glycosyltransferase [Mycobacterium eburneum]TDH48886.1 glycosyltransferase family 1 protein [Mycobacterium eburneum]
MKIKGFARQYEGGGYYRMRMPLDELGKHGHETVCDSARSNIYAHGSDIVVGQIIGARDHPVEIHRWWRQLRKHSKLVYELDDNPFEIERHNPAFAAYGPRHAQDSIAHCIEIADLVTASTEPLADAMRKINPNVVVLKNRIDEHMLDIERPRRDKLTIGWAGGASHYEDIKVCAHGLRKTLDHHPDVEAHFIGPDFTPLIRRPVRSTPWSQSTTDYYKLIDFDIGLAPLLPSIFTRSKSHIKALEYAALGIPVIASDVEPYRDFVIDGVTGWLVRRDHEWALRLRELINDDAMREEMGAKAKAVAAEWTIQKGWQEWEAAYQSVL